jgi:CheY-like chemotaxis protein
MNRPSRTILIVDDDKEDVLWLTEVIRDINPSYLCRFEQDEVAALRFMKSSPAPDLVFLDLNMPLKNGIECLRDIHNYNLLPGTPIVIYSTAANIKEIDLAYKYGAARYIVKPNNEKQLKCFVEQALSVIDRHLNEKIDKAEFVLMEGLFQRSLG